MVSARNFALSANFFVRTNWCAHKFRGGNFNFLKVCHNTLLSLRLKGGRYIMPGLGEKWTGRWPIFLLAFEHARRANILIWKQKLLAVINIPNGILSWDSPFFMIGRIHLCLLVIFFARVGIITQIRLFIWLYSFLSLTGFDTIVLWFD